MTTIREKNTKYINPVQIIKYSHYHILKLYVPRENQELYNLYVSQIRKHNDSLKTDSFFNSGFDIFVPEETRIKPGYNSNFVDMLIKGEMISSSNDSASYYMYPRSSLSKTPLLLANHVGIIDSGYRGNLISAFRNLSDSEYVIEKHTRLMQICAPDLSPIFVVMVGEDELTQSERGAGGFGSTGTK